MADKNTENKKRALLSWLKGYKGCVAIVTGAASGIGRALVEEFVNGGARAVILVDRQLGPTEELAATLQRKVADELIDVVAYGDTDVRNFEDIKTIVEETKDMYGRLDFIFNNAGIMILGTFEQIGVEDFNCMLDVNLKGVANGIHAAYPIMKEQGFGHIINTASVTGLNGYGEHFAGYGASKFGVVGLSNNLRIEAARHGVKVTVLCPGPVRTPMLEGGVFGKMPSNIPMDEIQKVWDKFYPIQPQTFAKKALRLVAKNKAIIILPSYPFKMMLCFGRVFPSLGMFLTRKQNDRIAAHFERVKTKVEASKTEPEKLYCAE